MEAAERKPAVFSFPASGNGLGAADSETVAVNPC
jgi:hypothetical protein